MRSAPPNCRHLCTMSITSLSTSKQSSIEPSKLIETSTCSMIYIPGPNVESSTLSSTSFTLDWSALCTDCRPGKVVAATGSELTYWLSGGLTHFPSCPQRTLLRGWSRCSDQQRLEPPSRTSFPFLARSPTYYCIVIPRLYCARQNHGSACVHLESSGKRRVSFAAEQAFLCFIKSASYVTSNFKCSSRNSWSAIIGKTGLPPHLPILA